MLRDPRCGAIIIDEGLSGKGALLDAVVNFCEERQYKVRIIINGDPHQLPPVVPFGSIQDVVAASALSSRLWHAPNNTMVVLRRQHRSSRDPEWAAFLRTLAEGSAPAIEGHEFNNPEVHATAVAMALIPFANIFMHHSGPRGDERAAAAIWWLFGESNDGRLDVYRNSAREPRLILTATNSQRNWWNKLIAQMRDAELGSERYTYEAHTLDFGLESAHLMHRTLRCCTLLHVPSHRVQAVNTANVRGGDELSQDMALEALRDEARMFDHADHSVPLSSANLGVGDLIMLPVRSRLPV